MVYREWAPAASSAHLIGDFNSWGGTHMEKDSFGVWKVTLPDGVALAPHMTHSSNGRFICTQGWKANPAYRSLAATVAHTSSLQTQEGIASAPSTEAA